MKKLEGVVFEKPFPHLVVENFYDQNELDLIWEELKFLTKPDKLLEASGYGGVVGYTNAKALCLDGVYGKKYRNVSNILKVNRKLFKGDLLKIFSEIHDCCSISNESNWDITKVRYYHNQEYYDPHIDRCFQFLAFSYFYKEPKRFSGGEVFFPKYDYEYPCYNNSIIILPGWVRHVVKKVIIEESDYYDGYGRYCISSFFGNRDKSVNESDTV